MDKISINKRALTYSLLAHINESNTLSRGQLDIFIPIVKKGMHFLCNQAQQPKGEHIQEISDTILNQFGIDIPIPVLRNILKVICREYNTNEEKLFTLNNDDSFWIHDYIFEDYDELIEQSKKELHNLQILFDKFCEMNNYKNENGIIQFIEQNKINISAYLANTPIANGKEYSIEAKFVDYFKNASTEVYNQIRNLYLGAILTSYLDYQPSNAKMNIDILLDTNFIISLLDLNTPESTRTCKTLIEIGIKLGYSFHVLSDTITESQGLLRYKAENFDKSIIQKYVNREDVYNACNRLNYSKTDLERIADNLPDKIEELNVQIIYRTDKLKNKAKFSKEYALLKPYRNSDKAALHDAMCIIYVKEGRGNKNIQKFEDAKCWWVNNAITHDFETEDISSVILNGANTRLPEMIKVDSLLTILWLTSPNSQSFDTSSMLDMGLSALIAYTFDKSLPKARIIKELDENIQKYKNIDISDKDVLRLATRIANGQVNNLEKINSLIKDNRVKDFNLRIKEEANKQEKAEIEQSKALESIVQKFTEGINELKKHKQKIDESSESKIEQGIAQHQHKYESQLSEKDKEIVKLKSDNIEKENIIRKGKRDKYINKQIKKWRNKTWKWIIGLFAIILIGIIWIIVSNNVNDLDTIFNKILSCKIGAWSVSIISFLIETFLFKNIYDKYCNHSNIKAFKEQIIVPDDLIELKNPYK